MLCFKSLWHSDAIWRHRSGSTLAQVMTLPGITKPFREQCWLIISKVQWQSSQSNFRRDNPATKLNWRLLIKIISISQGPMSSCSLTPMHRVSNFTLQVVLITLDVKFQDRIMSVKQMWHHSIQHHPYTMATVLSKQTVLVKCVHEVCYI